MSRLMGIGVFGIILSIAIAFLPTIIAFIYKRYNTYQMLVYQLIANVINIVICIFLNILPKIFIFNIIRNIWDVIYCILWIYFLVCAFIDKRMPRP